MTEAFLLTSPGVTFRRRLLLPLLLLLHLLLLLRRRCRNYFLCENFEIEECGKLNLATLKFRIVEP